jgi:hypothetical protein
MLLPKLLKLLLRSKISILQFLHRKSATFLHPSSPIYLFRKLTFVCPCYYSKAFMRSASNAFPLPKE